MKATVSQGAAGECSVLVRRPYNLTPFLAPAEGEGLPVASRGSRIVEAARRWLIAVAVGAILPGLTVSAATLYVALDSPNPSPPYANWATAARVIQDAVDAAAAGDEVVVTNGVYATGGRPVGTNVLANRVALDKLLTLRSVNGPEVTVIQGAKDPARSDGLGDGAIRCVYLAEGASLSGFTLTSGATRGSGARMDDHSGGGAWCVSTNALVTHCVLIGNSAVDGGGSFNGTLRNCVFSDNSAQEAGGGANGGTLYNCTLTGNSAGRGGGVYWGTLYNCTVTGNSASETGGGACLGALDNCLVVFNRAPAGANYSSASFDWGGSTLLMYSCTSPLPPGPGNIDADPQLASFTHLSSTSPCLGAGHPAYASGVDIDGEPWANPPAMGADQPGPATGPLILQIEADFTEVATDYPVGFTAGITGVALRSVWDFGDGTVLTNQPVTSHAWSAPGIYTAQLTAYNNSHPEGVEATVIVTVSEAVVAYVDAAGANPVFPYASWATAATNIQDALGASTLPGHLVLVTNGVYGLGTVNTNGLNRVALTNRVVLRSVNGPGVTVIEGATDGVRCAYVGDGSVLSGFTLTKGSAVASGGGVLAAELAMVTNCVISGNSAGYPGGGGACGGALYNCTMSSNSASVGGGAYRGILYNCTLTSNSAGIGGGAFGGSLYNCTLNGNSAWERGGGASDCTLSNCTLSRNSAGEIEIAWEGDGGGAYGCTLYNCTLSANSALQGGGVAGGGALYNCTLIGNTASSYGGGAYIPYSADLSSPPVLYNCKLIRNSAGTGGGAVGGTLYNCVLTGNSATGSCCLIGCGGGGGAVGGTLYNCTLIGNRARCAGGGALGSLHNCIVLFNQAGSGGVPNAHGAVEYCCTTPPAAGPGNIDADPQLITASHLSPTSPCVGAGNPAYASGVDIDGEPWANPPAMGADQPGATTTGPLAMWMDADLTAVASGHPVAFTAWNEGPIQRAVWDFGDGTVLTNQPLVRHAWNAPGVYTVRLTGYNDSHLEGVATNVLVTVRERAYVNAAGANPVFPYASWATAATNIQDAIGASTLPGHSVLVTNGVYRLGTVEAIGLNRVALTNRVVVMSVNGPGVTVIEGATNGMRCAYVGADSILSGFTLTKGTANPGGGVYAEAFGVVTNCTITGNSAQDSGGGAAGGTLYNCTLTGNSASFGGGADNSMLYNCTVSGNSGDGASGGTLYNCTVSGNSGDGASGGTLYNCTVSGNSGDGASGGTLYNCTISGNSGGGVYGGTLYNCIVYYNNGDNYSSNEYGEEPQLNSCCTTPLPAGGVGNIDADPRFVDAAAGDFRLRPDSPCIDAGTNLTGVVTADLLGVPRPLDGNGDRIAAFDLGAYEFNPYRFAPVLKPGPEGFTLTLQGEPGQTVRLERSRDLLTWETAAVVPIPAGGQTVIDPAATGERMLFYRAVGR